MDEDRRGRSGALHVENAGHDSHAGELVCRATGKPCRKNTTRAVTYGEHALHVYTVVREHVRIERLEQRDVGGVLFGSIPALP